MGPSLFHMYAEFVFKVPAYHLEFVRRMFSEVGIAWIGKSLPAIALEVSNILNERVLFFL